MCCLRNCSAIYLRLRFDTSMALYFPASCQRILCHGKMFLTRHRCELFDIIMTGVCRGEDHRVGRGGIPPGRTGDCKEMKGNLERIRDWNETIGDLKRIGDWNETMGNLERTGDWNETMGDLERMTMDWRETMGDWKGMKGNWKGKTGKLKCKKI